MEKSVVEKNEIAAAIANSYLFGKLGREVIEAIAGIAYKITLPPGTLIIRQEDSRANCYIVASGKVSLFRTGRPEKEYEIRQLGPGGSFGEMALLTDEPMPASAKTVDETHLIVIPRDQFIPILSKYPEVAAAIGKGVSRWLSRLGSMIDSQVEHQIKARRLRWVDFLLIIGLSVLCALAFNQSDPKGIPLIPKSFSDEGVSFIGPSEAFTEQKERKVLLIDAGPSELYDQEHIAGAESLPLSIFDFMYDLNLGQVDKTKEIIVYGRTISRLYDEEVAKKLIARGHKNVKILKSGLQSWKRKGYPVEP